MQEIRTIRKIVLDESAVAFRAEDGQEVVYRFDTTGIRDGAIRDRDVLYSPDGERHYALAIRSYEGTFADHDLSIEDRHHCRLGQVHRAGDELTLDGVTFSKVTTPNTVTFVPLAPARKPEYLFRLPDGQFVYVGADSGDDYSYESFRLYVGDGNAMRHVPILGRPADREEYDRNWEPMMVPFPESGQWLVVSRARDGYTCIFTEEGALHAPSPLVPDVKSWWRGKELERLDHSQFEILEFAATGVVTINPKPAG